VSLNNLQYLRLFLADNFKITIQNQNNIILSAEILHILTSLKIQKTRLKLPEI